MIRESELVTENFALYYDPPKKLRHRMRMIWDFFRGNRVTLYEPGWD